VCVCVCVHVALKFVIFFFSQPFFSAVILLTVLCAIVDQ
jgi:hypothetical protein